ncbi:hypothetical protein FRACYDRAFT_236354 [Fragilariopsis cylindrus CCMP1102]|uniref:Uncharacterized protein n=1 Tax=Fragilariopsis cylindrus CCMP1102 TaxID=635003 RepID=A0A1E7FQ32_9STRA|nr:hypothetical protein FRACYDRAFT_236354 [Fragilariopsis cylindrus CCMP1102]|eukprot:OEU20280.1 hypothetical protein FRACYDRAFT_236354 [Fragilariopsis cylindrus CCMP1102]
MTTIIQRGERATLLQTTTLIDDDHCSSACYDNYKNNNCSCSMILTRRLCLWSLPIIILLLGALLLALISSFSMESISMTSSSSISKLTLTTNDGGDDGDNDNNNTNNRLFPTTATASKSKMQPQSQSLLRGKQQQQQPATSTMTSTTEEEFNKKKSMKLSLWLIPPGGEEKEIEIDDINNSNNKNIDTIISHNVYKSTKEIIDELAEKYNGPKFIPHTTIIGSIEVDTEEDILLLSKKLKDGLQSSKSKQLFSTGIECTFNTILQEPSCWNQAMIIEMKASKSFTDLCILCRTIFNMEQFEDCITFPPPSKVPHMSLYYGTSPPNVPSSSSSIIDLPKIFGDSTSTNTHTNNNHNNSNEVEEHQNQNQKQSYSFQSYRVMLWKTDPASLEGVPNWIPIVDINLS